MQRIARTAVMWVVSILVLFGIMADVIPDIQGSAGNLSAIAFLPDIIGTVAGYWWIGALLLLIGVVMSTKSGRGAMRRFRRAWRRRRR